MNIKATCAAGVFAALSLFTLAAQAEEAPVAQNYTYGTHLDIKKVLAINEDPGTDCQVVKSHMTYLDSKGQTQHLNYLKVSQTCNEGG
ncbi:DUF2790 domain-containing protein [Pseudomonas sp. 7P_10.2_Bac1]|uniref:DUF2790 domain-containing protein n=1 Tax=Pseudomonas sp. 7P_10.2_Bac1 TaxID=2971614 RepID=UPI0021CAC146|nr:DUF2790 domain-containing protein [Pseudomonas sp. 7P_10.2_Bac1]MCU1727081.1 DUF2790 domain-containing protein [Pseudomonas sp. 7P_10.2_Bac1]